MIEYLAIFAFSFLITYVLSIFLIPRLKRFGIVGKDVNKPHKPEVAEMGGIAIVAGLTAGILLAVFFNTFFNFNFNLIFVLAGLLTIHSISFIGIIDDLLDIPQWMKAILPLFAAVPLIAVKAAGSTEMFIPLIGMVDFGILYMLVLVPLGIAVASNLTNMFAGFNGLEAGMGSIIFLTMSIIAFSLGNIESLIFFLPMLGALLAFLIFNKIPSKAFPGDIGNLTIGTVLATGVIIGNLETLGALILILYIFDFFIKLYKKFPSSNWWGEYKDGKLYAPNGQVNGLAQLMMRYFKGISEKNLVLFFILAQILISFILLLNFYYLIY